MTDYAAFFETILAYPDDDAPRLVFADYLDERGESERAEFIRVQCQLAACAEDDPERPRLVQREAEIMYRHRVAWWRELPELKGVTWESFERGFVSTVRFVGIDAFREHAEAVFRAAPVFHVLFSDINHSGAGILAASAYLKGVLTLDFENGNRIAPLGSAALANSQYLTELRVLKLNSNGIGPSGVRSIAESPVLRNLLELNLDRNDIYVDGATALIGDGSPRPLQKLSLGWTRINAAGLDMLFGTKAMANLRWLYLSGNPLGPSGLSGLARSEAASRIEALYAEQCHLGSPAVIELANSPYLGQLKWLYLKHNEFHDAGAAAILNSPHLQNIRELMLSENPIRDEGIRRGLKVRFGERVWV